MVAPLIATLPPIGVWYLTLKWSHCRNRGVAVAASIALGVLLYLGYYEIGMVEEVGLENAHRVGWLPNYVRHRMRTDVISDSHRPPSPQAPTRGNGPLGQAGNWFFFVLELVIVPVMFVAMVERVTLKAYCEPCRRWMQSEMLALAPGSGAKLWDSLQSDTFSETLAWLAITPVANQVQCRITVKHCPNCRAIERAAPVYFTINDVPDSAWRKSPGSLAGPRFSVMNYPGVRTLVNHAELLPREIAVLARSFPKLAQWAKAQPRLLAVSQPEASESRRASPSPTSSQSQPSERKKRLAQISRIEPKHAGRLLTNWNTFIQTLVGVVCFFAGATVAVGPLTVFFASNIKPTDFIFGIGLTWIGICMTIATVWVAFFQEYLPSRFMLRQTRGALKRRDSASIDLGRSDLVFVDIVPRANWGRPVRKAATDIGMLELNQARRELVFEGDNERYSIPAESILGVMTEFWTETHKDFKLPVMHYLVVVRAQRAEGAWEACFHLRHTRFRMRTTKRRESDARALENRIRELTGMRDRLRTNN